jgi:hypothetical protein
MSNHQRNRCSFLLGECQKLPRQLATNITIKRRKICDPGAVENREKKQGIFKWFSKSLRLLNV